MKNRAVFAILDVGGQVIGIYSSRAAALLGMRGLFSHGIDAREFRIETFILDEVW